MPLYEYECLKCKKHTERIEKNFDAPPLKKCPHCGGRMERLLSAPAIQFKGSGWYVTDYARPSTANSESKGSDSQASGDKDKSGKSEKSEKSDSKSAAGPAEKSPASAKEKKKSK